MRLLLIGPSLRVIGGATVMFANLLRYVRQQRVIHPTVVCTNPSGSRVYDFVYVAARSLISAWRVDFILLNVSRRGVLVLGGLVRLLHTLSGTPYSIRIYGGNFDLYYRGSSRLARRLMGSVLSNAAFALVETRQLQDFLENDLGAARPVVRWLPNTRAMAPARNQSVAATDFFFAGHINSDKGVETLLHAARLVRSKVRIHFFGAAQAGELVDRIRAAENCTYEGELSPEELLDRIREMDALVFPTHYAGEGYPGIIVESMLLGKPVISTRWRAIPEMVQDNGILVEPRDPVALAAAIDRLHGDRDSYRRMSEAAFRAAGVFSSDAWLRKLIYEYLPTALGASVAEAEGSAPDPSADRDNPAPPGDATPRTMNGEGPRRAR